MTDSAIALLGFIAWTLLLMLIMESMRSWLVLSGRKRSDSFRIDGSDVSPFAQRLARAHANCYESFPIVGGLLLLALATGTTVITDQLALWLLAARVAQSITHLVSAGALAVQIRFACFVAQLLIAAWWVIEFVALALA
jgi:uncharacterized MAPEG superfamily protein